jgi:hypothetical protein
MRNFNVDSTSFCSEVERLSRKSVRIDFDFLRSSVVDSSTLFRDETVFNLMGLGIDDFVRLSITSWYIPEEIGILLRMDLEKKSKEYDYETRMLCEQLLISESHTLLFLLETKLWSSRDFFGNMLTSKTNLNKWFKLNTKSSKVVKAQRKRGYHDKGSRKSETKWRPKHDWLFTQWHYEMEAAEESLYDSKHFAVGFIT